ncbi:MAG: hypothetical protein K8U57_33760 [Planctomycetes bacterium]|nr:hypothetical protein [Planctomycetota bacterium]
MDNFKIWLLLTESGRLDRDGFNSLFRANLEELLARVTDQRRRAALIEMMNFDWIGYILASLRNASFRDEREREEAAHDITVHLLSNPGQLFAGYDPRGSGPMPARFALSVANAIRNLRRAKARRSRHFPKAEVDVAQGVPAREPIQADDEMIDAFRRQLRQSLGQLAVELLDLRLDGLTYREIGRRASFNRMSRWQLRQLVARTREAGRSFAEDTDEEFLGMVERLLTRPGSPSS